MSLAATRGSGGGRRPRTPPPRVISLKPTDRPADRVIKGPVRQQCAKRDHQLGVAADPVPGLRSTSGQCVMNGVSYALSGDRLALPLFEGASQNSRNIAVDFSGLVGKVEFIKVLETFVPDRTLDGSWLDDRDVDLRPAKFETPRITNALDGEF